MRAKEIADAPIGTGVKRSPRSGVTTAQPSRRPASNVHLDRAPLQSWRAHGSENVCVVFATQFWIAPLVGLILASLSGRPASSHSRRGRFRCIAGSADAEDRRKDTGGAPVLGL
jgi:hypothetical protein